MRTSLLETLKLRLEGCQRVAILGIGSELRGDDAAGVLLARQLHARFERQPPGAVQVAGFEGANAPENVTGAIARFSPDHIVVVDAAEIGAPVGTWREIDLAEICETLFSTHTLPLKVVIDYLCQATGAGVTILGVQPGDLDFGAKPTRKIKLSVKGMAENMTKLFISTGEISNLPQTSPPSS